MDIAYQLLKDDYSPSDERDTEIYELAQEAMALGLADNWEDAIKIATEEAQTGIHPGNQTPGVHPVAPELAPTRQYFPTTLVHEDATEGIQRRVKPFTEEGTFEGLPFKDDFRRSEPMDIAMRLLKTPVSPEAKRHKLEYDKKYQDTPERIKYREDLNRERRQRGVYGKGGKDMSHTKDGKIVPEDASKNRARHFKGRGTLKSSVLVKR